MGFKDKNFEDDSHAQYTVYYKKNYVRASRNCKWHWSNWFRKIKTEYKRSRRVKQTFY